MGFADAGAGRFGGSGLGCVEAGIVMERSPHGYARHRSATGVLAPSALSRGGSAAQKSEYLPKFPLAFTTRGRSQSTKAQNIARCRLKLQAVALRQWFQA